MIQCERPKDLLIDLPVDYIWPPLVSNSLTCLEICCREHEYYRCKVLEDWPVARMLDHLTAPALKTLKLVVNVRRRRPFPTASLPRPPVPVCLLPWLA
jgi:hypothetical protein